MDMEHKGTTQRFVCPRRPVKTHSPLLVISAPARAPAARAGAGVFGNAVGRRGKKPCREETALYGRRRSSAVAVLDWWPGIRGLMSILLTGAAGFIGFHVARALRERGERVLSIDN